MHSQEDPKILLRGSEPAPPSRLRFCSVVDVEEEFDWSKPFSRDNKSTTSASNLIRAQEIFGRYGVTPAYMLTYPMATTDNGRRAIENVMSAGKCLIGAQLHPWVTPPMVEEVTDQNSYPMNLPAELESEKISVLVDAIQSAFGVRPKSYKAGRYGLDLSRSDTLLEHGFKIDTSVMPFGNYTTQGNGPDFFDLPQEPFWLNPVRGLLAIPATQSVFGSLEPWLAPSAIRHLFSDTSRILKIPSVLSRLRFLERVRLSPEGSTLADMKRVVDARIAAGAAVLNLTFHSPSLMPGHTPYVQSKTDLEEFINRIESIIRYVVEVRGAIPSSIHDVYDDYTQKLAVQAPGIRLLDGANIQIAVAKVPRPAASKKKIMFVSGFFPPHAPVGAVRTEHLADHWRKQNHDVRTIAVNVTDRLDGDDSQSQRYYLPYREPGGGFNALLASLRAIGARVIAWLPPGARSRRPAYDKSAPSGFWSGAREVYRNTIAFPDRYSSWISRAVRLGLSWEPQWRPDIIYSSGPPHSSHRAAAKLARRLGVPWIAELRDLWANNPYDPRHWLIEPFYDSYAKVTLSQATACVVVTATSLHRTRALINRPVFLSYNGFDPSEFANLQDASPLDADRLTIMYAGSIYVGRRDPTPLFKAIESLGDASKSIKCIFFGDVDGTIERLADEFGITESVEICPVVSRREILRFERQVDILLDCRWSDKAADGVIPGKIFEYVGAKRPIISIGSKTAEAACIIKECNLGLATDDPKEITLALLKYLELKKTHHRIPDLENKLGSSFQRTLQFEVIDRVIDSIKAGRANPESEL